MLTVDMMYPLLQQMFKMAFLCMDTSRDISSPFFSHLIDISLLYARPDLTQTLLCVSTRIPAKARFGRPYCPI